MVLGALGVLLTCALSGLFNPEVRHWIGLDRLTAPHTQETPQTPHATTGPEKLPAGVAVGSKPSVLTSSVTSGGSPQDLGPQLEDCQAANQDVGRKSEVPEKAVITSVGQITTQAFQKFIIRGKHFGTVKPFNGCSSYFGVVDLASNKAFGHPIMGGCAPVLVTNWNDSEIVVEGFPSFKPGQEVFQVGDPIKIEVANPQQKELGSVENGFYGAPIAWYEVRVVAQRIEAPATTDQPQLLQAPPTARTETVGGAQIACVGSINTRSVQKFVIRGKHFGVGEPFNGCSSFIRFVDLTNNSIFGHSVYFACTPILVTSWNDSEIVVEGFPSFKPGQEVFKDGDVVRVEIANPQQKEFSSVGNGFDGAPAGWYVERVTAQEVAAGP
jgi:hypothetical protein